MTINRQPTNAWLASLSRVFGKAFRKLSASCRRPRRGWSLSLSLSFYQRWITRATSSRWRFATRGWEPGSLSAIRRTQNPTSISQFVYPSVADAVTHRGITFRETLPAYRATHQRRLTKDGNARRESSRNRGDRDAGEGGWQGRRKGCAVSTGA